jgi:hypothetical protein
MEICKSFNELRELCKKYGLSITEHSLYTQQLFGKSGYYEPIYEKHLLAHNENKCNRVLNNLKEQIESIVKEHGNCFIEIKQYDDIDVENSIRNLTECYGYRERYLSVNYKPNK